VQILEDENARGERTQQLVQGPKQTVPLGSAISERRRWRREDGRQLRQDRAQRTRKWAELRLRRPRASQRVEDGTERERLGELLAAAPVDLACVQLRGTEELLDQPGLAHSSLPFDQEECRWTARRREQGRELFVPAHQRGGR
jgi:hypothetical protein